MAEVNPFAPVAPAAAASSGGAAPATLKAAGRGASRYASGSAASSAYEPPSAFAVAQAQEQIGGFAPPAAAAPARSSREIRRALVTETPRPGAGGGGGGGGEDEDASVAASPPPAAAAAGPAATARGGVCFGAARSCTSCYAAIGRSRCGTMGCLTFAGVFALALFAFSCALLKPSPGVGTCDHSSGCGNTQTSISGCISVAAPGRNCDNVCADPLLDAVAPFRFSPSLPIGGATADSLKSMLVWCGFPQANVNWRVPLSIFTAVAAFAAVVCVATKRVLWLPLLALLLAAAGALFLYVMGIDGVAVDKGDKACKAGLTSVPVVSWNVNMRPSLTCDTSIFAAVVVLDLAISPVLLAAAFVLIKHRAVMLQPGYGAPPPPRAAPAVGPNEIDPKSIVFGDPRAAR